MLRSMHKLATLNQVRFFSATGSRMQIENILILGSGLMGSGIAQSAAQSPHEFKSIVLQDVNQKALDKAKESMLVSLGRMKKKTPEIDEQKIVSKIQFTSEIRPASDQNLLVVEAVPELLDLKQKLFQDLSNQFAQSDSVILATNTSSLPCHEIGVHVRNKQNFAGLHFFSPVPLMKLVEVVKAEQTSDATVDTLIQFVKNINKVPVKCKDTPGFIVNRLLIPYMNEALKMLERGDATAEDIDLAMKLGAGYPMGPFQLQDMVGIDVYKFIVDAWKSKGADFVEESPLIDRMVKEGKLGRKTGQDSPLNGRPMMEILYTPDYLIVKKPQFSLWFKRYETVASFEFKTGIDFGKFDNLKCLGIGSLIGSLKQDSLLFAVRSQFVGQVPSDQSDLNVHLIKRAAIVDLNADLDANELFDNCPVHGLSVPSQAEQQQTADNLSAQTMQKTWNTIKSTAGLMTANANFSLNDEILKMFNETDSFFYAENGDLTNSLQRKNTSQYLELCAKETPFWQRADDRFFFNRHLLGFLIDRAADEPQLASFIVPIMQGFVQIEDCKISLEETNEFRLILISRRSRFHAGTRFKRRGVDENGRCANYVETEQILKCAQHTVSFVQVRGSIPVFWSQPGLAYRPTPVLDRTMAESQAAFRKHFEQEFALYDSVIAISLIERNGRESIIGDAYLNCVLDFDSEKLSYITFDFHDKCRGMKFGNVNLLIDSLQEQLKEMLFFWKDTDGVICRQSKVFRINCIDCLDRTNLVQSAIAKFVLLSQMNKLALLAPDCQLPFSCRKAFQQLWANNGDCISRQYAGTKALKGDYTRLGERRFTGVMKDSYNSASRYYINRFKDAYRQAAIDTVLGQIDQIDLPDLAELSDQNNNEAEEDSDRVKQIIDDVKMFCIPENEIILGSWALVSSSNDEMDSILVLCKDSYHLATYDEARDRVTKCQCVLLEDIEKIELGPEPNQLFSSNKSLRQSYAIRINYLFNQTAGYFHMFRSSNTRFFNNMAIPVKTSEDAIESLRSIAESFKVALSVKHISVPIFEGKLVAKKSKKPTTVFFAKKIINQQLQRLPRNISDNNLLRFKNVGKSALNNVSSQFARFRGKFTGSTRSNINLPEIYECDSNDMRNNSCTSLSIVAEDMDYVKTSLKPRLTDPSTIASSSSIALYTTEEELAERTLSSEFSSTEEDLEDEDDQYSSSFQNDEDYSKSLMVDTNDTLLESCGILHSTSKHQAARPKSETGLYASSDEVDSFVLDSMKKNSLNQMLNEVKRKACSPKIQITSQQDFRSSDFRSSDCFLNTTRNLDNSVSCANLNSGKENRTSSLGENEVGDLAGTSPTVASVLNEEDCTRSTMDIFSNKKRNQLSSPIENRIKSSKSETPLNDLNLASSSRLATIGKRDLIFNPLTKIGNIGRGLQNISLISRRYNKSLLLSTEELEQLAERKSRSKSLIVEIE